MTSENTPYELENTPQSGIFTEEVRDDIVTYIHQDTGWQEAGDRLRALFPRKS